jgi:hypothetical protein
MGFRKVGVSMLTALCILSLFGCSVKKATPVSEFTVKGEVDRNEMVVLDRVEGNSKTLFILFGLVQVIDDSKVKVFWIPFYEEKFAIADPGFFSSLFVTAEDRAYYNALAATPDADTVLPKSYSKEKSGVPMLFSTTTVKFTGKALKLKTDTELRH